MTSVQPADPAARRRLVIVVLVVAAVGVAGHFALESWLGRLREEDPAQALPQLVAMLLWTAGATSVLLAVLAVHLFRLGGRVRSTGRFPPPGHAVVRATRVLEGDAARRRGALLGGLGAVLLVVAVALFWAARQFTLLVAAPP